MADILPPGAIPADQFEAQMPSPQPGLEAQATPQMGQQLPAGAIPESEFQSQEQAYGSTGQKLAATAEGLGRGVLGPVATIVEKSLGIPDEDIIGRERAHPYLSTAGEMAGLTAGAVTGFGEAAVLAKAGEAALGVAKLAKPVSYAARVGSSIVQNAAEMATYQAADEVNKYILNEPISAQSAIADIGLASALGGATGGFLTGVVSPLWKATAAPKVDEFLGTLKTHLNSASPDIPNLAGVTPKTPARTLRLTHFSGEPREFIDPAMAGTGVDAGVKGRDLENKLSHYYMPGQEPEKLVTQTKQVKHEVDLDLDKHPLYDFTKDPEKIIQQVKDQNNGAFNMDMASKMLKEKGFAGFHASGSETNPGHVALFEKMPVKAINGVEKTAFNPKIRQVADEYAKSKGFQINHDIPELEANPDRALEIARAYEHMEHAPNTKETRKVYDSLIKETRDQWEAIKKTGLKVEAIQPGMENPYKNSQDMIKDVAQGHMWYFPTDQGFGTKEALDHPLMGKSGEMINGKEALNNDIFRIVHDYFGHAKEGFKFGANGEENAWHHHMQMYTPEAQKALTSETRGQNSWVNFGPHGKENRANPQNTIFAEQKAGIMPSWTYDMKPKEHKLIAVGHKAKEGLGELGHHGAYDAANQAYEQSSDETSVVNKALKMLGINASPTMKAAMSRDSKAVQIFNELREAQHPEIIKDLQTLPKAVSESVAQHMGVPLEDAANYSKNEAGQDMLAAFTKEYDTHYAPVAKEMEVRNNAASKINVPDEARRDFGGTIIERGMNEVGTDSPYYPTYEHYAQRVMAKDDIGGLDKLKSELFNKAKSLNVDNNEKQALRNIRSMISDFQETQIENHEGAASRLLGRGLEGSEPGEILMQRKMANERYKNFATMSDELSDHLGTGGFRGAGTLKDRLEGITPENLVDRFSPKGNANSIPFLEKYFPETLQKVREVEAKKFLSPAITTDQGEHILNIGKLNRLLEKTQKGSPEYANFVLPKEAQEKLQAAQTIMDSIPGIKSSGTAGWMTKMMRHVPASAMSAIGMLMGHNPIAGYLLGEIAERMGRDIPDAMKLSYLKYLGSDKAVSSTGFKAMFDMISAVRNGEAKIANASKNVIKAGAMVVSAAQMPTMKENQKLDKIVTSVMENPNKMTAMFQNGQLSHYMPDHQSQAVQTASQQLQYLQQLKPKPFQASPLDKPIEPSKAETARYNRALTIANNPLVVMQHVKDGTVQTTDLQDLKNLYPAVYNRMTQQLSNELMNHTADEGNIPYKTRMGISLFLGQAIDSTMTPQSIMSAQPQQVAPPQQQQPNGNTGNKSTAKMGKENKAYMTQDQAAEKRSAVRD